MRLLWKENDITGYITGVTWAGSAKQAARTLDFTVAYSPNDGDVKTLSIKTGDKITFYPGWPDNKTTVFVGQITTKERKSEAGELSYTAMDGMIHLLRSSGTYKFTNTTPEKITQMICKDVGVGVGNLSQTKVSISKIFFQERPYYEIIMAGYTKAHKKNKKLYIAQMNGSRLEVIEKGKIIPNFHIIQGERILSSSYSESIDNMVNRVYIYDSNNKKIGSLSNGSWIDRYGVFQNAISVDSGNGKAEGQSELHGVDKTASLSSIGDIRCVAGMGVLIKDGRAGLTGNFWIESDSHEWSDGNYTMNLELAFKNIMDVQEEDEEQEVQTDSSGVPKQNGTVDYKPGNGQGIQSSNALNDVLNMARSILGVEEYPPGSNHNKITQAYGFDAAWCCMTMWYIFNKSGHADLFMGGAKEATCFNVMNWYKKRGKWGSTPRVGSMIIYGFSHIGIVESISGSSYVTIEGNYQNAVKRRTSHPNVLGFCYVDYPVAVTTGSGTSKYTAYALSESQLRGIARLCQQEQGTATGAAAEASLMANLFEKRGKKYGTGASGLYNYVQNSGWFSRASYWMAQTGSLNGNILEVVRKVLVYGNRTLPNYIDEHDCLSDISYASNHGSAINPRNKSSYIKDVTKIKNRYGSNYTFYCFPDSYSDPFGYTSR